MATEDKKVDLEERLLVLEYKDKINLELSKIQSDLDDKCDYILHIADMATRQATSARIKYNLDHPKENYPFVLELFIYFAVSALPVGAVFSSVFLTIKGFFDKKVRNLKGNNRLIITESDLAKKLKALDDTAKRMNRFSLKDPKSEKHYLEMLEYAKSQSKEYSLLNSISEVVGSTIGGVVAGKIIKSEKESGKRFRGLQKEVDSEGPFTKIFNELDRIKSGMYSGFVDTGTFEEDVAFFNEMNRMVLVYKRSIKTELEKEKQGINELILPSEHLKNYLHFLRYFNEFSNKDNSFPLKDPEFSNLDFESAIIARMELIIWARLYNWKNKVVAVDLVRAAQHTVMIAGKPKIIGPSGPPEVRYGNVPKPILPKNQHKYFKNRFIDSSFYKLLGPQFIDAKNRIDNAGLSQESKDKQLQEEFVVSMARLREDLLGANDKMKEQLMK